MLSRALHIFCSFWLVVLLLFGGTAKEAVHAFAGHTDTEHHADDDKTLTWGEQHHHCAFLSFHIVPFDAPATLRLRSIFIATHYLPLTQRIFSGIAPFYVPNSGLRGPPECDKDISA